MKKIFFALIAFSFCISMDAQVIKLIKDGEVIKEYFAPEADNVVIRTPLISPISGTATAMINGSSVNVKWYQYWKNGPKFAEVNVGYARKIYHDFGRYYAWNPDVDIATQEWGANWRLPTRDEFKELIANCDVVWSTASGKKLLKIGGRDVYAQNSLLTFPEAGYSADGSVTDDNSFGYYLTSTPDGSSQVYCFKFEDNGPLRVTGINWNTSISVRAVLKE